MDKDIKELSVDELEKMLISRYGNIPTVKEKYEAYEFLKKKTGINERFLSEESYRKNIEKILESLNL